MYDIVYSIIAHEDIQCVLDLLKNIFSVHECKYKIFVILHLSDELFLKRDEINKFSKDVNVNPSHFNSKLPSFDLVKKHIENFEYVDSIIKFKIFSYVASNCMFFKSPDRLYIENMIKEKIEQPIEDYSCMNNTDNWVHSGGMKKNDLLKEKLCGKIGFYHSTIEGWTCNYTIFKEIVKFIKDFDIENIITEQTVWEEVIFESIKRYLTGKGCDCMCKVFYYQESITKEQFDFYVSNKGESNICSLKRIPRNMNDPIRLLFRERFNLPEACNCCNIKMYLNDYD
jgi:hypothetical protein